MCPAESSVQGVCVPVQSHEQGATRSVALLRFPVTHPFLQPLELMLCLYCALTSLCFHACLLSLLMLNYQFQCSVRCEAVTAVE